VANYKEKIEEIQSKIHWAADAAAQDWYRRQCADLQVQMYLYFKPGVIAFYIGPEPLSDLWQLAREEPISNAMSRYQVCELLETVARNLPLLPA